MTRARVVGAGLAAVLAGGFVVVRPLPRVTAQQTVIIDGRGFGHGVGMAQDGAYWMGRSGQSASQILQTFFPGTTLAKRGGAIRVPLGSGSTLSLSFPAGGRIGGTKVPAGGAATVTASGSTLRVSVGGTVSAPSPLPTADPLAPAAIASPARILRLLGLIRTQSAEPPTTVSNVIPIAPLASSPPASPPTTSPLTTASTVGVGPVADPAAVPVPVATTAEPQAGASGSELVPTVVAPSPAPTTPSAEAPTSSAQPTESTQPVAPGDPATPASIGSSTEAVSSGPIGFAGRRYRGSVALTASGGTVRAVNVVDVEQYLRGMGEILTPSWPAATLQTQAIAARTYALKMMGNVGEVCPTQRCQVYLGAQAEYGAMDAAVAATAGKVVVYRGQLANTFYSASGGGTIASSEEAFGGQPTPYLRAGVYPTGDLKGWTVTMSLGEVARRVGYRGTPSGVAITKVGPSGRAIEVTVSGSAGEHRVPGPAFDAALGLRSTFFTFRGSGVGMAPLPTNAVAPPLETIPAGPDTSTPGDLLAGTGLLATSPASVPDPVLDSVQPADTTTTLTPVSAEATTIATPSSVKPASASHPPASTVAPPVLVDSSDETDETNETDETAPASRRALIALTGTAVLIMAAGAIRRVRGATRSRKRD